MKIIKYNVCTECYGNLYQKDCVCSYQKYETIELEFQVCECCDRRHDYPLDSDFNEEQFLKYQ